MLRRSFIAFSGILRRLLRVAEAFYISGKRGTGKGLVACRLAREYLRRGCPVATNMDLRLDYLAGPRSRVVAYRLPDCPKTADLEALPRGNANPTNEKRNGLLLLDEVSVFLNARAWSEADRKGTLAWLAQSRKDGWDLCMLGQNPSQLDKQVRDGLIEVHGTVRRLDKYAVPVLSPLWKFLTGKALRLPSRSLVIFRAGFGRFDPVSDKWLFRGDEFFRCYDTLQKLNPENPQGLHCFLPGWHLRGRYMSWFQLHRAAIGSAAVAGFLIGGFGGAVGALWLGSDDSAPPVALAPVASVPHQLKRAGRSVVGVIEGPRGRTVALSDGTVRAVDGTRVGSDGTSYLVAGEWVR